MVPLTVDIPSGGSPGPYRVMDMVPSNDDVLTGTDLYAIRPNANIIPFNQYIRNMRQVNMVIEPGIDLSVVFKNV